MTHTFIIRIQSKLSGFPTISSHSKQKVHREIYLYFGKSYIKLLAVSRRSMKNPYLHYSDKEKKVFGRKMVSEM
jgi:hypothetical protein